MSQRSSTRKPPKAQDPKLQTLNLSTSPFLRAMQHLSQELANHEARSSDIHLSRTCSERM